MSDFRVKGVEGVFTSSETRILAETINTNAKALLELKREIEDLKKQIEQINQGGKDNGVV